MEKLNIETFGNIMDEFLMKKHIQMFIDMPEGTIEPIIEDNVGLGSVVHFYILLQALPAVFKEFSEDLKAECTEEFIDGVLKLVKRDILDSKELGGGTNGILKK